MAIILNDNIRVSAGKPQDDKYLKSGANYASTAEVNASIPISERSLGLTVRIGNVEYWYGSGLANGDLVLKTAMGSASFTDLDDVPSSYVGHGLKSVRVNAGATALEFYTPTIYDDFLDLTDTPDTYVGQGLKSVRVNAGATALEFYTPTIYDDFLDLTDTPNTYSGMGSRYVKVNATADGLEFAQELGFQVIKTVNATTYLFLESDHNKFLRFIHASGTLATIPTGLSDGWKTAAYRAVGAGPLEIDSDGTLEAVGTTLTFEKTGLSILHIGSNTHVSLGAFGSGAGAAAFTQLSDVPTTYVGQALKFVRVNADPDALEFVNIAFTDLPDIATNRFLGRVTASTGDIEQLTPTQATAMLDVFTSALKGVVPASGGGTTNFLRADGTWAAPPGGGGGGYTTISNNGSALTQRNTINVQNGLTATDDVGASETLVSLGGLLLANTNILGDNSWILSAGTSGSPLLEFRAVADNNVTLTGSFGDEILDLGAGTGLEYRFGGPVVFKVDILNENELMAFGPLKLMGYTTVGLPDATVHTQTLVYDTTLDRVTYSDGADWINIIPGHVIADASDGDLTTRGRIIFGNGLTAYDDSTDLNVVWGGDLSTDTTIGGVGGTRNLQLGAGFGSNELFSFSVNANSYQGVGTGGGIGLQSDDCAVNIGRNTFGADYNGDALYVEMSGQVDNAVVSALTLRTTTLTTANNGMGIAMEYMLDIASVGQTGFLYTDETPTFQDVDYFVRGMVGGTARVDFMKIHGLTDKQLQVYGPIKLMNYATGSLPAAASHQYAIAYDSSIGIPKFSDGSSWRSLVPIIQEEGSGLTLRTTLNFIGSGITAADDAGNTRTNITIHDAAITQAGVVTVGAQTFAGPKTIQFDTTAGVSDVLDVVKSTAAGNGATGDGVRIRMGVENASGTIRYGYLEHVFTDATNASEDSRYTLMGYRAGAQTAVFQHNQNGDWETYFSGPVKPGTYLNFVDPPAAVNPGATVFITALDRLHFYSNNVSAYLPIATADDTAYGGSWNGNLDAPTKNAVYDKIESLSGGSPGGSDGDIQYRVNSTTFGGFGNWDGTTMTIDIAPASTNTVLNLFELVRNTSGAAATGIGLAQRYGVENGSGTTRYGELQFFLTDVTDTAEDGTFLFKTYVNGASSSILALHGGADAQAEFFGPTKLFGAATGSLPSAGSYDQNIMYDTDINHPVFSDGSYWKPVGFTDSDIADFKSDHFDWGTTNLGASGQGWAEVASGTGAQVDIVITGVDATENCDGVAQVDSGSTTTSRCHLSRGTSTYLFGRGTTYSSAWRLALVVASDATNTYTAYHGFFDNGTSGDAVDGCYFRYTHSVNTGKWEAVSASNSARTATDTGVAPTAGVFQIFEVRVNAAATTATFFINGSLVVTHTTGGGANIPSGAGRNTGFQFKMENSAGTGTGRQMLIDWWSLLMTRTAAR